MNPERLEVWLARIPWGHSQDLRPCIVVEAEENGFWSVACVSSALDLYDINRHFLLDKPLPDFKATGLHRTSYVSDEPIHELSRADFHKRLGRLEGELARDFDRWIV